MAFNLEIAAYCPSWCGLSWILSRVLPFPWERQGQQVQFFTLTCHLRTTAHFQVLFQWPRPEKSVMWSQTQEVRGFPTLHISFHASKCRFKHALEMYWFGLNLWSGREDTGRACTAGGLPRAQEVCVHVPALSNSVWGCGSAPLGRHILVALFQSSLQTGCLLCAKLPELVISHERKRWSMI